MSSKTTHWKPFLRQLLIASGAWIMFFCLGLQFGTITVAVPQLRHANVTVSDEMMSWLSSALGYAAIPWIIILNILAHNFGRKKICIFTALATVTSNVIFCFSTTPIHLLITEIIYGVTKGTTASIYVIVISEYTCPKYRGIFLCVKAASFMWGIWVANTIGTFFFWRYIPIVSFTVGLHSLTVLFWPESPYWLASENRLMECRKAYIWLNGKSENSEVELNNLIQSQTALSNTGFRTLKDINCVTKREFYLPLILSMLGILSYHMCGKMVITAYALDIIKKMIKNESTVYYTMLFLDGITVFSAYVGCFITKLCKRRSIWFVSFSIVILFLLMLSLYTFLVSRSVCSENVYISIFLLAGFSVSISSGPWPLSLSWSGELIPYRYKSVSIVIVSLWFVILYGTTIKVSPVIIRTFGLHGTFLFFALSSALCIFIMYFYLPETKDKTLLEIENYFSGRKTERVEEAKNFVVKIFE